MNDSVRRIRISEDSLESFAVYEKDFYDITLLPLSVTNNSVILCDHYRQFTLDDMAEVLEKVVEDNKDTSQFFLAWFEPMLNYFYDNLMLNHLFGEDISSIDTYHMVYMPQTDDDLLCWIIKFILYKYRTMTPFHMYMTAAEYINAEDLLHMIDYQIDEADMPVEQRYYIDEVKEDFIREFDNDLILQGADTYTKKLFRKYVNELCLKKNYNALRIKGFACSGGNSAFKCDWHEAASCMEILWREGGFGYAANALGFMHYDGRLTDGVPDYEQAFKYFSIGHTFGIYESTFKLAQMSLDGIYVAKNYELAAALIEAVYEDTRSRFEDGDVDCAFAEAALNMGNVQLKAFNIGPESAEYMRVQAYGFFIQAKYALSLRSFPGGSISDRELIKSIDEKIGSFIGDYKVHKASIKSSYPGPLKDFVRYNSYGRYKLILKKLKNDRIKMSIIRFPRRESEEPLRTLLTYREFGCCSLTDSIHIIANNASVATDKNEVAFDDITLEVNAGERSKVVFYMGEKIVTTLEAQSFTINKPK
ncbi:MAG: hypothetical protein K6F79_05165 [Saccharofermentans sp.]|nr:hypothetical protein [Saccharofermentans sp.]